MRPLILGFLILLFKFSFGQLYQNGKIVFNDEVVHRIDVSIHPDTLSWLYNSANLYSDVYKKADFEFKDGATGSSVTIKDVGFRLRGNTSRQADKKSFKIQFDEFVNGQELDGLDEINLKGAHNDPTLMREWLSYYLFREHGVQAPRVSFTQVYINGSYYGLYVNVEHIDKRFLGDRFGNNTGNLYKCLWGADLSDIGKVYDNGVYELKTNEAANNRANLETLIDVLNNSTAGTFRADIFSILNVAHVIKYLAIEALVGHWDGYSYNKNNYYLYFNEANQKFEFIPYDPDNTFGIDWIGKDWGKRNIYDWYNTNESRLLASRLLSLAEFHKLYSENISILLNDLFNETHLFPKIESQKQLLRPHLLNDPYYPLDYGFSINDFDDAFVTQVASHAPYGLKPYISERAINAFNQLDQQAVYVNSWSKENLQITQLNQTLICDEELIGIPYQLFNISGQLIADGSLKSPFYLNELNSGIYILSVPSIGLSKKLIVNQ